MRKERNSREKIISSSWRSALDSTFRFAGRSQPVDATPSDVKVVIVRQGRRYGLSAAQRTDIWRRWKAGESLHEIGRAFGKDHGSIQFLLSQHGGIAPAVRRRPQRTLTLAEREDISRGIASGSSIREIAKGLQRAASTVSRGGRRDVRARIGRSLYGCCTRPPHSNGLVWKPGFDWLVDYNRAGASGE